MIKKRATILCWVIGVPVVAALAMVAVSALFVGMSIVFGWMYHATEGWR